MRDILGDELDLYLLSNNKRPYQLISTKEF